MRAGILTFFMVLLGSVGASSQHAATWLSVSGVSAEQAAVTVGKLEHFVASLRDPGPESFRDHRHLSKIFRRVHQAYLKRYEAYSDFNALFADGRYDCLTATMLFAEVLSGLGYDFKIIETNYHIFIQVQTEDGLALLESTDRARGFVTDPDAMAARTTGYRSIIPQAADPAQTSYRYQFELYQEVQLDQLTGLLRFNQAVKAYNSGELLTSARLLEDSFISYPSDRCMELGDILVRTLVARKEVTTELRRSCMEHLLPIILQRTAKVAVNAGN